MPTEIPSYIEQVDFNTALWGNPILCSELYTKLQINLPTEIKQFLKSQNITIVFVEDSRGIELGYGYNLGKTVDTNGLFSSDTNAVYVETMNKGLYELKKEVSDKYDEYSFYFMVARDRLYHELGHYLDFKEGDGTYLSMSSTNEFIDIY